MCRTNIANKIKRKSIEWTGNNWRKSEMLVNIILHKNIKENRPLNKSRGGCYERYRSILLIYKLARIRDDSR